MVSSWSVTFAMALTTTTGFCPSRPLTIVPARSMALASCTEVPPNFITIIGGDTSCEAMDRRCWDASPQVAPHLEQFGIQQRRTSRAANGVVGKHRKLPVEHSAGPQTPDRGRHAFTRIHIKARLRTIRRRCI